MEDLVYGSFWIATLLMTGVIWFVQLVHYPSFRYIGAEKYHEFQSQHIRRTTWIVAPLMLIELVTSLSFFHYQGFFDSPFRIGNLILLAIIWISTTFVQVPLHNKLHLGLDEKAIDKLVRTNWIRTVAWSIRSIWMLSYFA